MAPNSATPFSPINTWPADERPREKLLARGAGALTEAELLAIFLRTGVRGASALDLARQLLSQFQGLRGLLGASQQAFCSHKGLGLAKFAQLQAVVEICRRYLQEELDLGNPSVVRSRPPATSRPSFIPIPTRSSPVCSWTIAIG